MNPYVSESETGQDEPKPNREQRDAAFSSGAGRKAVEIPKEEQEIENRSLDGTPCECTHDRSETDNTVVPIGLDLETKADELQP